MQIEENLNLKIWQEVCMLSKYCSKKAYCPELNITKYGATFQFLMTEAAWRLASRDQS